MVRVILVLSLLCALPLMAACQGCAPPEPEAVVGSPVILAAAPEAQAVVEAPPTFSISFDQPMNPMVGAITLIDERGVSRSIQATQGVWSGDYTAIVWADVPDVREGKHTWLVRPSFESARGEALLELGRYPFVVRDTSPPSISRTRPASLDALEPGSTLDVIFSEPMRSTGTVRSSPAGSIASQAWENMTTLSLGFQDLAPGQTYTLSFDGFEDAAANPLDAGTTRRFTVSQLPDTTPPRVVGSSPAHQSRLPFFAGAEISVRFDEPVRVSEPLFSLEVTQASARKTFDIQGTLDASMTTLTLGLTPEMILSDAYYALNLSRITDLARNPLSPEVLLDNGSLEFSTTSESLTAPVALAADPMDGARNVSPELERMDVVFDRAMDREPGLMPAENQVYLSGGADRRTLQGTWDDGATRLTFSLDAPLLDRTAYSLYLGNLKSAAPFYTPLDASEALGGDRTLHFTTRAASAETCAQALTLNPVQDGVATYTFAAGELTTLEGEFLCDPTGSGADAVVRYEKTSGSLEQGGRMLRVSATSAQPINLELSSGTCEQSALLGCGWDRLDQTTYLDVGAGSYIIRVAGATPAPFPEVTVEVEELSMLPGGELCARPFDSAHASYDSPEADTHRWSVAAEQVRARDDRMQDAAGVDAFFAIPKARAGSLLDISVQGTQRATLTLLGDCAGSVLGRSEGAELHGIQALAGTVWLRVTLQDHDARWPDVVVTAQEVDVPAGASCATATPITAASFAPANASTQRRMAPGCFPAASAVEWYSLTLTERTLSVASDMPGAGIALMNARTRQPLGCTQDAQLDRLLEVGDEVCIALEVGATTQLEVSNEPAPAGSTCASALPLLPGTQLVPALGSPRAYAPSGCPMPGQDVTWFAYTASDTLAALQTDGERMASVRASTEDVLRCGGARQGARTQPGERVCVAVPASTSSITLSQSTYTGITGPPARLPITWPGMTPLTGDRWMSVHPGHITLLSASTPAQTGMLRVARTGGAGQWLTGLDARAVGYAAIAQGEGVVGLDDATGASTPRLYPLELGPLVLGPALDVMAAYEVGAMRALATDQTSVVFAHHRAPMGAWELELGTGQVQAVLGFADFAAVTGLAMDAAYVYVAGALETGEEGVFRVARAGVASPELLAQVNLNLDFVSALAVDDLQQARHLYYRASAPQYVGVVAAPGGEFVDVGEVARVGDEGDYAMAYDLLAGALIVFGSEAGSPGDFYSFTAP